MLSSTPTRLMQKGDAEKEAEETDENDLFTDEFEGDEDGY